MANRFKQITLMIMILALLIPGPALGQELKNIPVNGPQMLRVWLDRLKLTDRLDMVIDGIYGVTDANGTLMVFPKGSELVVLMQEGNLMLYFQGMSLNAGPSLNFKRYEDETGQTGALKLAAGSNLYQGDLKLTAGDSIQAVLTIHVEDYLCGVVPYEMSNSFPIEALKAQAITARTYAMKKAGSNRDYDLVDTTNDQVFMGKNPQNTNAFKAIEETRGIVAYYDGKLANCYYTASNGGQTEKASHVWGGSDLPYYAYVLDEYDVKNSKSVVKKLTVDKYSPDFSESAIGVMLPQLKSALEAQGLLVEAPHVRIERAENLAISTPMYEGSLIMTELSMDVVVSGQKILGAILPAVVSQDDGEEELTLFATLSPTATPSPTPEAENIFMQITPEPTPEPIVYSDYITIHDPIHITLKIFPDLDNALGLSINSSENEIMTLEKTEGGYVLYSRRYGHGVGMSQRGAEYMAGEAGKTYKEIMDFYYPGVQLVQYSENTADLTTLNPSVLETPGPAATPTPKPTLVPVTETLPAGAWYAKVTGIEDNSWLNLRQEPNMDAPVVMRLYKNQRLIVLEKCQEEGFVKVKNDEGEGYVVESFLTKE